MTVVGGSVGLGGSLGLKVLRGWPQRELTLGEIHRLGRPQRGLPREVNTWRESNWPNLRRGLAKIIPARAFKIPHFYGQLFVRVSRGGGEWTDWGLAGLRLVTTVGVKFICDDMNAGGTEVSNLKYHAYGTGTNAEAAADTALQTELTTQYATDSTRPTGSQASATAGANATYTTVGTLSPDSGGTIAITEHGIFSASSAGTLLDRTVFSAVNLVAGSDSLQTTYVFTANSGG